MRSYLQTNLGEFANAFARENNIDHITPESIAKAIAHSQGHNPPPPPGCAANPATTKLSSNPR